jgi:hypothetical protein
MIGFYILGPLGLLVSFLSIWNLRLARTRGEIRARGIIRRSEEPRFFWFVVGGNIFAMIWFGFIGLFVTAYVAGLIK